MGNEALNEAVERLLTDGRFLRRFRRSPERALRGSGLSRAEVCALREGRPERLLALGLDPAYVWPSVPAPAPLEPWLLRNARRLGPAVLLAAWLALWAAPAQAKPLGVPRGRFVAARRIARRMARRRTGLVRARVRASGRARGLVRARRRAGVTGHGRAFVRVSPEEGPPIIKP